MTGDDWVLDARCKGLDTYWFYPEPDDNPNSYVEQKAFCQQCPVINACREAGREEKFGVWGGTSPIDRGFIRKRRPDKPVIKRAAPRVTFLEVVPAPTPTPQIFMPRIAEERTA
jgi:hypothetical protein